MHFAFVMFMSFVWMEERFESTSTEAMSELRVFYEEDASAASNNATADEHFDYEVQKIRSSDVANTFVVLCLFAISFGVLISNYSYMRRKQMEGELLLGVERMRADTDPLTGVRSKVAYVERELEINEDLHQGKKLEFAVGLFDMNNLKKINDELGHETGDEYIKMACKLICDTFKRSPVYRTGGDEFVVIAEDADYACYEELMESLLAQSRENCRVGGVVVAGGMVAYDPARDNELQSVFRRADELMYERKKALRALAKAAKANDSEASA